MFRRTVHTLVWPIRRKIVRSHTYNRPIHSRIGITVMEQPLNYSF